MMLLPLCIILWSGILCVTVRACDASATLSKLSLARGDQYGCSKQFYDHHCWKYCKGNSGKWCYTVKYTNNQCTTDIECKWMAVCQEWCAWNSPSGCSKTCHEEAVQPQQPSTSQCATKNPWWQCQTSYGSGGSSGGKWISPEIPNDIILNGGSKSLTFNGNIASATKSSGSSPLNALWYPMSEIKVTSTTFYWTFKIRETGTPSTSSSVAIGLSDLNKLATGYSVKGLFYNGPNLSDGSGLLIGNFGPKLKNGDKCSILVKLIDGRMKVYIILNDKSLGLAFDVPETTLDGIYPAVKLNGDGFAVEIVESLISDAPTKLDEVKPLVIEGNWTLNTLGKGAILTTPVVTMTIAKIYDRVHDHSYRLRINAVNKFMGSLIEKSKSVWTGEIIDKTAKQGTAAEMKLEADVSKHITGIRKVVLDVGKSELRVESTDSTSVWKPNEPLRTTVNYNPFRKGNN